MNLRKPMCGHQCDVQKPWFEQRGAPAAPFPIKWHPAAEGLALITSPQCKPSPSSMMEKTCQVWTELKDLYESLARQRRGV